MKTFEERRDEMDYGNDSKYLTGWQDLLMQADALIAFVDPDYTITQIKEKFGGLRYYYELSGKVDITSEVRDAIHENIRDIEKRAGKICEACGIDNEKQNRDGWYTTICDRCLVMRKENQNAEELRQLANTAIMERKENKKRLDAVLERAKKLDW